MFRVRGVLRRDGHAACIAERRQRANYSGEAQPQHRQSPGDFGGQAKNRRQPQPQRSPSPTRPGSTRAPSGANRAALPPPWIPRTPSRTTCECKATPREAPPEPKRPHSSPPTAADPAFIQDRWWLEELPLTHPAVSFAGCPPYSRRAGRSQKRLKTAVVVHARHHLALPALGNMTRTRR